jgi:hypothetical protein
MKRLRPLSEQECYLRCYGSSRGDESVTVLPGGVNRAADAPSVVAERIRRMFDSRLDGREPEAA